MDGRVLPATQTVWCHTEQAEEALLCLFMNLYLKTEENLEYLLCALSRTGPLQLEGHLLGSRA